MWPSRVKNDVITDRVSLIRSSILMLRQLTADHMDITLLIVGGSLNV